MSTIFDHVVRQLYATAHRVLPGRRARNERMVRRIDRSRESFIVPTILVPAGINAATRRRQAEQLLARALSEHALPDANTRVMIAITCWRGEHEVSQRAFTGRRAAFWGERGEEVLATLDALDADVHAEVQVAPLSLLARHIVASLRAEQGGKRLTPFSPDPAER